MAAGGFAFGPYQLDLRAKSLTRDGELITLTGRQFELLAVLVSAAGSVISKDDLIRAAWGDVAVTDNSVAQAVSQLRMALDAEHPNRYIINVRGRGYRFVAPVAPIDAALTDAEIDARVAPYRLLMDGYAALQSLNRTEIAKALALFGHLVVGHRNHAGFHMGFANACALHHHATRGDLAPDTPALERAIEHARMACRLAPDSGGASATLGFVLACAGDRAAAIAALRRATDLEPDNWRHHVLSADADWGQGRLRAARRALVLLPHCPFARPLIATVFVARDALGEAEKELDAAAAATWQAAGGTSRSAPIGVSWLKGLLCHARGDDDGALVALRLELTLEPLGHMYSTEVCAQTWYAIGVIEWRRGDTAAARAAYEEALTRMPRHLMARVGLALLIGDRSPAWLSAAPPSIDVAIARAALLDDVVGAATIVRDALAVTPAGSSGWLIPIEPLLRVWERHDAWAPVLAMLRERAS